MCPQFSQVLFLQFFCHGQICDSPVVLLLDYRLWLMRFYLSRSLVAECSFPVLLCFCAPFLLLGCGRQRNNFFGSAGAENRILFFSVVAAMGIIFCQLWLRRKSFHDQEVLLSVLTLGCVLISLSHFFPLCLSSGCG